VSERSSLPAVPWKSRHAKDCVHRDDGSLTVAW
jgi:hypothetical protein